MTVTVSGTLSLSIKAARLTFTGIGLVWRIPIGEDGEAVDDPIDVKMPDGVAVALNAPSISGGGFLQRIEAPDGRVTWRGGLALRFADSFELAAFGVIELGGNRPWTLLLFVTVRFTPPYPLAFGLKLTTVGGLLALNRTMAVDALRDAVLGPTPGTLDTALFAERPEEQLPVRAADARPVLPGGAGAPGGGPAGRDRMARRDRHALRPLPRRAAGRARELPVRALRHRAAGLPDADPGPHPARARRTGSRLRLPQQVRARVAGADRGAAVQARAPDRRRGAAVPVGRPRRVRVHARRLPPVVPAVHPGRAARAGAARGHVASERVRRPQPAELLRAHLDQPAVRVLGARRDRRELGRPARRRGLQLPGDAEAADALRARSPVPGDRAPLRLRSLQRRVEGVDDRPGSLGHRRDDLLGSVRRRHVQGLRPLPVGRRPRADRADAGAGAPRDRRRAWRTRPSWSVRRQTAAGRAAAARRQRRAGPARSDRRAPDAAAARHRARGLRRAAACRTPAPGAWWGRAAWRR